MTSSGSHPFTSRRRRRPAGGSRARCVRPRCGTGARNGLSVSTSRRSSGHSAAGGAHVRRVLEGDDAAERDVHARRSRHRSTLRSGPPVKQCSTVRSGTPSASSTSKRSSHASRRVDDESQAVRVRQRDLRREGVAAARRGASARSSSRARTRPPPPRRRRRRPRRARAAPRPRRRPRWPRAGAGRRRPRPAVAPPAGGRRRAATVHRLGRGGSGRCRCTTRRSTPAAPPGPARPCPPRSALWPRNRSWTWQCESNQPATLRPCGAGTAAPP